MYIGDYDPDKAGGYGIKNRVTMYGSEFESKIEGNTYAPAEYDETEGTVTFDEEHWAIISNGTDAWLASAKIKELGYYAENPEYIRILLDNNGRIINGVRVDGTTVISKLQAPELDKLAYAMQQEDFYNVSRRHAVSDEAIHYDVADGWEQVAYNQSASPYAPNDTYHEGEVCNVSGDNEHSYKSLTTQVGNYPAFERHYLKIVEFANLDTALSWIPEDIYNNFAAGQTICFVNTENIVEYWKMQNDGSWDAEPNFTIDNPEYLSIELDKENNILGYTAKDGSHYLHNVKSETIDALNKDISALNGEIHNNPVLKVFDLVEDPEGRLQISTDSEGKIVSYRKPDGTLVENVGIELSDVGLSSLAKRLRINWSDYISNDGENPLHLSMPKCARINLLTKFNLTELSKKGYSINSKEGFNYDIPIEVEFWDMQGNYFKKKAFIGGQGDSTMAFDKKNIAIDLFDSEWDGDAFSIKFGDWVAQDSFHLKAYDYEPFIGVGTWTYKLFEQMMSVYDPESDHIWKKALLDSTANTPSQAYGNSLDDSSKYNDTGARCFPDGFPVVIYQNDAFWGVFALQLKKHRDNYHLSGSKPNHVFLDGKIGEGSLDANGDPDAIRWDLWEIRNPKNLVYTAFNIYSSVTTYKIGEVVTDDHRTKIYKSLLEDNVGNPLSNAACWADCGAYTYKYDADVVQAEIAGNHDGSTDYDSWSAGSYNVGKIVSHNKHLYMNVVANNTKEPVYDEKNNSDSSPDFKNKTKCGWLNVTNTVKVKENIFAFTTIMTKIDAKETAYLADPTAEKLAALKAEFETYFDVQNLIDYIIITDVTRDDDAFWKNWLWTTYDGVKWWCNLYDCNITFGYGGEGTGNTYRVPAPYVWDGVQRHLCTYKRLQTGRSEFMLRYIVEYYTDELNHQWMELRNAKVIDEGNIYNIAKRWVDSIGLDAFALENEKWGYVKHIDNMMRIYKWICQSVLGLDQLYGYFDNLYADCTIYRSTERDYTIRCIDMKVSHKLSRKLHYIKGYITRHESAVGGVTVSTYSITGGEETGQDMTKTYVRVKDAITAAASQPVDVPSESLFYIEARCENIEYHRK